MPRQKIDRHLAEGEIFLLTFLFIGLGGYAVNQDFGSIVVRLTAVASTAPRRLCASTPIAPLKWPNTIAPSRLLLNQECGQRCRSGQSPHSRVLSAFQNYNSSNGSRPKHRFLRR